MVSGEEWTHVAFLFPFPLFLHTIPAEGCEKDAFFCSPPIHLTPLRTTVQKKELYCEEWGGEGHAFIMGGGDGLMRPGKGGGMNVGMGGFFSFFPFPAFACIVQKNGSRFLRTMRGFSFPSYTCESWGMGKSQSAPS